MGQKHFLQVHFQDKTLMPNKTLIKMKEDFKNKNVLFIVHPIEGVISSLSELVSRLQCTVWGLQCTNTAPLSSIQDLAEYYVKVCKSIKNIYKMYQLYIVTD